MSSKQYAARYLHHRAQHLLSQEERRLQAIEKFAQVVIPTLKEIQEGFRIDGSNVRLELDHLGELDVSGMLSFRRHDMADRQCLLAVQPTDSYSSLAGRLVGGPEKQHLVTLPLLSSMDVTDFAPWVLRLIGRADPVYQGLEPDWIRVD